MKFNFRKQAKQELKFRQELQSARETRRISREVFNPLNGRGLCIKNKRKNAEVNFDLEFSDSNLSALILTKIRIDECARRKQAALE